MVCRLFGAKPLPEPIMTYCQLDPYEQTSVKIKWKYKTFHSWKCIWKCRQRNGDHFVQGEISLKSISDCEVVQQIYWNRSKIMDILQTTFANEFLEWKITVFRYKFHWVFHWVSQLTINQHWTHSDPKNWVAFITRSIFSRNLTKDTPTTRPINGFKLIYILPQSQEWRMQ